METKDFVIGILLIGIVALAGVIGYLSITLPSTGGDDGDDDTEYIYIITKEPTTEFGLPDDWSTAPNTSFIILYNETGDSIPITLKQILNYVNRWYETENEKYWWEKRLEPKTVKDPASEYDITGVNILDLLRVFDCNYAGALEFISKNDTTAKLEMDVIDISNKIDNKEEIILGIAANKEWLQESPIGEYCGNFSMFGNNLESTIYNLAEISVTKNWTVDIIVDGNVEFSLDYYNLTTSPTGPHTYVYEDTGHYNFNRTYWGRNITDIVNYTSAKDKRYEVNFIFSDNSVNPSAEPGYNWTDVERYLANNGTHIVGNFVDYVNGSFKNDPSGDHMLATNLKMCLVHKIQFHTEYERGTTIANNPWPQPYNYGYPPYQIVIPGRMKSFYWNGLIANNITTYGAR